LEKLNTFPKLIWNLDFINEHDIPKTSFLLNNGKYELMRIPFGLTNTPRIFQRAMHVILREKVGKMFHVYMDDIILFSKSIEQRSEDQVYGGLPISNYALNVYSNGTAGREFVEYS